MKKPLFHKPISNCNWCGTKLAEVIHYAEKIDAHCCEVCVEELEEE